MKRNDHPARHIGLLLLRIGLSAGMLTHGWPKLLKLLAGGNITFADPLGIGATTSLSLAVLGEVVFPALVIVGLRTRITALPVAITMAVALFGMHWGEPFKEQEKAFLYLVGFLGLVFTGGGKFGLDALIGKKSRRKTF